MKGRFLVFVLAVCAFGVAATEPAKTIRTIKLDGAKYKKTKYKVAKHKATRDEESPQRKKTNKVYSQFKCDGRTYCSQMKSYEEALFFIQHCPNTKMDGDEDGIPCERQFGKW